MKIKKSLGTTDDARKAMAIAHRAFGQGELKIVMELMDGHYFVMDGHCYIYCVHTCIIAQKCQCHSFKNYGSCNLVQSVNLIALAARFYEVIPYHFTHSMTPNLWCLGTCVCL